MYINITCNNVHVMLFPTFAEAQALLRSAKVGPSCPAPLEPDAREMKQLAANLRLARDEAVAEVHSERMSN